MSAKPERELAAVAFQLLGTLGEYEQRICDLVEAWPNTGCPVGIDAMVREMQDMSGVFPEPERLDWLEAHLPAILELESKYLDVLARKAA